MSYYPCRKLFPIFLHLQFHCLPKCRGRWVWTQAASTMHGSVHMQNEDFDSQGACPHITEDLWFMLVTLHVWEQKDTGDRRSRSRMVIYRSELSILIIPPEQDWRRIEMSLCAYLKDGSRNVLTWVVFIFYLAKFFWSFILADME